MNVVTIPNIIPSSLSAWLRMWQWNAHTPFSVRGRLDEHRVALARRDEHRVGQVGLRQREAVLRDHELRDAVQVHRVDLQTLVEVVDLDGLARPWR